MRKNLMLLALAAIGLASCNGGYKKGENGMLYKIYTDKAGAKIQEGDFILYNLIVKNDADSTIFNSYDGGRPQTMLVEKPIFKGDLFDGLKLLTEGDSASIKLSVDSVFKTHPKPASFKGNYVIYNIKIEKLVSKSGLNEQQFESNVSNYMMQQSMALKAAEPGKIKSYIADKKLNVTKADSGFYYVITKNGTGPVAKKGDVVVLNYTGSILGGKIFDSNIKAVVDSAKLPGNMRRRYIPVRFVLGEGKVIAGWDQGLLLLNKGSRATFILPSSLAYGDKGNPVIGPDTPVAFDIELLDIIHPDPNAARPAPVPVKPQTTGDPRSMKRAH